LKQKVREVRSFTGKLESNEVEILLLGISHGRGIRPMLQETFDCKFDVYSIFKLNVFLQRLFGTWKSLVKALPSSIILL
jgi:hypothetical protein